jgi:thioredoxin reductase (NADPH)
VATGITDASPALPGLQRAIANGLLRYCPICDGYEALDKKIAVVGPLQHACKEAAFLRTYSRSVTVLPLDGADGRSASLRGQGIELAPAAPEHFQQSSSGVSVRLQNEQWREFDVLYSALGCIVHSELATALGARCNELGNLEVDSSQCTSIEGLHAAGHVVSGRGRPCRHRGNRHSQQPAAQFQMKFSSPEGRALFLMMRGHVRQGLLSLDDSPPLGGKATRGSPRACP